MGKVSRIVGTSTVALAAVVATMVMTLVGATEPAAAAFPGSNGTIAFTVTNDQPPANPQIYGMNADGLGQTQLSHASGLNFSPDWSADGDKVAFVNYSNPCEACYTSHIYWMNADGSGATDLTKTLSPDGLDDYPSFFPDYHKIAFQTTRGGSQENQDIWKITVDDNGDLLKSVRLTTSASKDIQPAVSPDGKKIAFTSNRDGDFDLYVMRANEPEGPTNVPVKLTRDGSNPDSIGLSDGAPYWSPDGKRIAFQSTRMGDADFNTDVWVMEARPEGSTNVPVRLTSKALSAYEGRPAWSPDGKKIAFQSYRGGNVEVFKMRADGTRKVNLTKDSISGGEPSWQPLP